ncbi:hypothetical protein CHH75_10960 [Paenibacillus sp. 7541]|nr:hypothetical protein CHH75_10960 [Paenibacillus sp. 7541]
MTGLHNLTIFRGLKLGMLQCVERGMKDVFILYIYRFVEAEAARAKRTERENLFTSRYIWRVSYR